MKPKYIYVATTYDKYELPVAVADSVAELAEMTGKNQKYKALICDYCHGEVEMAYVDPKTGDHICADCLDGVLETVKEEDLNE